MVSPTRWVHPQAALLELGAGLPDVRSETATLGIMRWLIVIASIGVGCGGSGGGDESSADTTAGTDATMTTSVSSTPGVTTDQSTEPTGDPSTDPTSDPTGDPSGDPSGTDDTGDTGDTPAGCEPLPAPSGEVIDVEPGGDLAGAIANAPAGATVMLADGTYDVGPDGLWVGANDVTIRSASGNRDAVILDGGYQQVSGGLLNIAGRSGVTVAHLSIRRARYHTVHVTGGPEGPSPGARLYDLHLQDPGEQAVKINSNYDFDNDDGEIACSSIELTDEGRAQVMMYESSGIFCYTGGIDAHRARGWTIRDNDIRGFWCSNEYLSEHGIHLWRGCRDTIIERNLLVDNARGIGLGLGQPNEGRTYDDDPCPGVALAGHYGGVIRNNVVIGTRPELFASPSGMDVGIALEAACNATIVHNTVASTQPPYSSIEWRWPETTVALVNNLVTHNLRERDGGVATPAGNLENADIAMLVDPAGGDAHLVAGAAAIDAGDPSGVELAPEDLDGDARTAPVDVGADERTR